MFKKTKNLLAILFAILFVITSINPTYFAQGMVTAGKSYTEGTIKSVHAAGNYSVLLNEDGTVATFGCNNAGQLGYETDGNKNTPTRIEGLTGVKNVFPSEKFVFALKSDGTLWAWGHSKDGQFGNGFEGSKIEWIPIKIPVKDVKSISGGDNHSVLAKNDGAVYTWGKNTSGQLGNGKTDPFNLKTVASPIETGLIAARTVVAGNRVTMVLKNDGTVWACGWNLYGQLGIGSDSNSTSFNKTENLDGVEKIALSVEEGHGIALKDDGTVWTWGYNSNGQLGDGTDENRNAPVRAGELENIVDIDTGLYHTVALRGDGTVWTWGKNEQGQLGNGSNEDSYVPVMVEGLTNIISVAAGENHTIALDSNGTAWAWGDNSSGQLGDGTNESTNLPVEIIEAGQSDDTEPPIWNEDARINADWVGETSITIGWNKNDVTDNVGVTGFKIYKDGELVDEVDSDTTTYVVDKLERDTEYIFKISAVDEAYNESTNGPELSIKTRVSMSIEIGDDSEYGWISDYHMLRGLTGLDMDESWPPTDHDAPRVRKMYSALNRKGTKSWYSVEGVRLSYFLDELREEMEQYDDWPEYYKLNIYEIDGSGTEPVLTLTKAEIEAERYCILSDGEKIPVEPIIAYKEIKREEGTEPDFEGMVDCNYKLFIGQTDENDANNSLFISRIAKIGVEECEPETEVDKTALQSKVDEVIELKEDDYTEESWEAFAIALADAQEVLGDEETTQEMIDNALDILNSAIDRLEIAFIPLTIVVKKDGAVIDTIEYDLSEWEDVKRQHYSARNSGGYYRLAAAEGVYLSDLLDDVKIDIDSITGFNFISTDGYATFIPGDELLDEERYYYPNIYEDNKEEGAVKVGPMLALKSYAEDSDQLPPWDMIDKSDTIRLFVGQKAPGDINYSMFAKLIHRLEIEIEEDEPVQKYELNVKDSDDYEIEETETGIMLTLKQDVTGFKHFGVTVKALEDKLGELEVVFTHLRDNMQRSLNSIKADSDAEWMSAEAGFNIEPGDVIKIFMVDELTNETDCNPIIFR